MSVGLDTVFRSPGFLLLGLFGLGVLLAFLRRRPSPVVVVPSVLVWQSALERRARRRRFARLQQLAALTALLLAVGALTLAAADPEPRAAGRVVFVVDGSGSMGDAAGAIGRARALIDAELAAPAGGREVALIFAGARPEILVPPTRSRAILRAGLAELGAQRGEGASDVDAALRLGIEIAAAGGDATNAGECTVVLVDDGTAALATALREQAGERVHLERRRVPGAERNVAITLFAARPPAEPRSDADRELLVAVASTRGGRMRVELEGHAGSQRADAGWAALETREVEIPPGGGEAELRLRLQLPLHRVRARVESVSLGPDSLPQDDVAELALAGLAAPRAVLVGAASASERFFVERALASLGVERLEELPAGTLPEGVVVVQFGAPTQRFDAPTLYVPGTIPAEFAEVPPGEPAAMRADAPAPPVGGEPAPTVAEVWPRGVVARGPLAGDEAQLREVHDDHPLMRGVALTGATFVRLRAIEPGEGRPLVTATGGGAVVAAGGAGRGRWVHLGVGANGSDLVLRVAYPVLMANAIRWLGGGGEAVAVAPARAAEVRAPIEASAPAATPAWTLAFGRLLRMGPGLLLFALGALLLAAEGAAFARGWVR